MRGLILCSLLSGCIAVPEPRPYETMEGGLTDAQSRDAGLDARVVLDATLRDAAVRDGAVRDASFDAAMVADASTDALTMDAAMGPDAAMGLDAATSIGAILVTEFRTRGPSGANDEFVEIANATTAPIDVGGFRLRAASATGTVGTRAIIPAGVVLGPGERLLFANGGSSGYSGSTTPDVTYTFGLADECGIAIDDGAGIVHDSVGTLAASTLYEGTPRMPLTDNADRAHARRMSGATPIDTNDNASDFETIMPSTPESGTP